MKKTMLLMAVSVGIAFADTNVQKAYQPFEAKYLYQKEHRDLYSANAYAYAPSTVYYNGTFHQFYCSTGSASDDNFFHPDMNALHHSWDHIRYRTSKNGSTWSAPRIAVTETVNYSSSQNERCACDPSVVRGPDGYWYMMYDGNLAEYSGTVVYLARSEAIQGPYYKYTKRGTWERFPEDPKPLLKYKRQYDGVRGNNKYVINPKNVRDTNDIYGVGQQSVVYLDGYFHVWFNDKNIYYNSDGSVYYKMRYIKTKKLESLSFDNNAAHSTNVVKLDGVSKIGYDKSGIEDVRWNPATERFELWTMQWVGNPYAYKIVKYYSSRTDGVNWTKDTDFNLGPYNYIHNMGISGNEYGWIHDGRYLMSFSGPNTSLKDTTFGFDVSHKIWPMYQKLMGVNNWSTYSVRINNGAQLDVAPESAIYYTGDFDGDGITDIGIIDYNSGNWYTVYSRQKNGYAGATLKTYKRTFAGITNAHKVIVGDFDGDGKDDRGMYRASTGQWFIYSSKSNGGKGVNLVDNDANGLGNIPWGWTWSGMSSSHTAYAGDYDGDGITDRVIVDGANGIWYMLSSRHHDFMISEFFNMYPSSNFTYNELWFGTTWPGMGSAHEVVVGDFDGDGITDKTIVNKSAGLWYVIPSRTQNPALPINYFREATEPSQHLFGFKQDGLKSSSIIAIGDYDGDGIDDLAFVNRGEGRWYFRRSTTAKNDYVQWNQLKNSTNIKLLPGDYDGDGITDMAFMDRSARKFYVRSSKKSLKNGSSTYGVSETIYAAYPLYSSNLSKKHSPEMEEKTFSMLETPMFNLNANGKDLSIWGLTGTEKVSVMDIRGKAVFASDNHGAELNISLPAYGKYVVRVGAQARMVTIK